MKSDKSPKKVERNAHLTGGLSLTALSVLLVFSFKLVTKVAAATVAERRRQKGTNNNKKKNGEVGYLNVNTVWEHIRGCSPDGRCANDHQSSCQEEEQ